MNNKILMINNYIKQISYNNKEDITVFFHKIIKYCNNNKIEIDLELWCELISSNEYLRKIVKQFYELDNYDNLNSEFIKTIIDAYKIIEDKEIDVENIDNNENKVLSKEEVIELCKKIQDYDENDEVKVKEAQEAKEEMIKHNKGLVYKIAHLYAGLGLEFEDLIQEGNIGLITAIEKFNYELNYKFSTYAIWWIRQRMSRAIDNTSKVIRIPSHMNYKISYLKKMMNKYGIEDVTTNNLYELSKITGYDEETIKILIQLMLPIISFDQKLSQESNGNEVLGDFIEDTSIEDFSKEIITGELFDLVFNTDILTPREKEVIKHRIGYYNQKVYTVEEIGKILGISKERAREIESKAYRKLRKNQEIMSFKYDSGPILKKEF